MLDLYTWHTPNGRKPAIMLAELELPYELHLVDISRGEQKRHSYLELNPNGKIPALVDVDSHLGHVVVFESGAILQYLGEKYGRFLPRTLGGRRAEVLSWLFWHTGGPGPFFGQLGTFGAKSPRDEMVYAHFFKEAKRLVDVLEHRLVNRDFIADEYSVADIGCFPWFEELHESFPEVLEHAHEVKSWLKRIGARPWVRHGMRLEQAKRARTG
jgi:GST-like protein